MTTMMISTPMRETAVMKDWKTLFPDFATLEGSCLFIKKLIAVSLSSITYIRRIFPKEAYGERSVGGLKVKLLSEGTRFKSVEKFINLIRSCYDAVEKKYLQQMSVGVCYNPENPDEVIEAYNLVFRYSDDKCSVTCNNGNNIKTPLSNDPTVLATFNMLKSINTISDILGDLPEKAYISIKLLYYDDVTPEDYEPDGFEPSSNVKFSFVGKTMNLKLGKIDTENHSYKFLLKTTVNKQSSSQLHSEEPFTNTVTDNGEQVPDKENEENSENQFSQKEKPDIDSLNCPCELKSVEDSDVIACLSCQKVQHKSCYGILKQDSIPPVFYCVECILYNSDGHTSLDMVYSFKGRERQVYCGMRRALYCCIYHHIFTVSQFEKLLGSTKAFAKVLLDRLEFEGFIKKGTSKISRNRYVVNKSVVQEVGLAHYFSVKENNEVNENTHEKDDNEMDTAQILLEQQNSSPERSQSPLEASINKVKALSLHNQSFEKENSLSRKRKSSLSRVVSPNETPEVKKRKTRRLSRKRL